MSTKLADTRVSRAGVTARHWNFETSTCLLDVEDESITLRFDIASKGGGRTDIFVQIGLQDVRTLLGEIGRNATNGTRLLLDAVLAAEEKRNQQRNEQQKSLGERASAIASELEELEAKGDGLHDRITELWIEDSVPKSLWDESNKVVSALWQAQMKVADLADEITE